MRIIYLIASLHQSGGTERVLTTKMNYLADHMEQEVYVIMRKKEGSSFFSLSPHVKQISWSIDSMHEYKCSLEECLLNLTPDIVISVGGWELSFLNTLKDGSKKVLEFHYTKSFLINFVKGIRKLRFKKLHLIKVWLLQRRIFYYARKFDKVVGLTERDVQLWGSPRNMTYIYNPLSFRTNSKSNLTNKIIIAVGSFTSAKGMDLLVEAFGKIASKFPDWRLELYGSGQDYDLLLQLITQYHIEKQVRLNEPCRHIEERLIQSSIYAFPSRTDGFGLVLTEAMECGLPCVAFDCECGPREIISKNSGILVPSQDVDLFAEALSRLMLDERLRKTMGKYAQKEVRRFYVENIMPQWMTLFEELKNEK